MKIAITGGTGFVGRHLARELLELGHSVVLVARSRNRDTEAMSLPNVSFCPSDLSHVEDLTAAFKGCDTVAHLAGINREIRTQTYQRVHVEGTANVVQAAKKAGVKKLILLSFLRARPNCGSAYHESKWQAEELIRNSGLDYTVLKSGMIYGEGDHMLDHLSHALHTLPVIATVGFREQMIRPVPIQDLVRLLYAAVAEGRLSRETVAVTGAEELTLSAAVRRIARVLNRNVLIFPMPLWFHRIMAAIYEIIMKVPLVAQAQIRILQEGVVEAAPFANELPADLRPRLRFTPELIRSGLPVPEPFGLRDLRCCTH
jgi:uncharacterized protein YbjT (DUF2867 family)